MKNRFRLTISQLSLVFIVSISATDVFARGADYHTFGLLAGLSFPKLAFAKADLNFSQDFGLDFEASLGVYWSIQQTDLIYYFSRGEWSPYIGLGIQNWNFYGLSTSTTANGVFFGNGTQAIAATVPLGLLFVADNGVAFELAIAGDIFTNAPTGLQGKVIPEVEVALGYFF
jgi:hypothetical protein